MCPIFPAACTARHGSDTSACSHGLVGAVTMPIGVIVLAVGAPLLGVGVHRNRVWRVWRAWRRERAVVLVPRLSHGYGAWTAALTLRF